MKTRSAGYICLGGILSALTVLFQASPSLLPAAGMLLSPFASLPIAVGSSRSLALGISTLAASVPIVLCVSPEECVILLLTTGPFGIAIGSVISGKIFPGLVLPSFTLFTGISFLTYAVGIPAFGDLTASMPPEVVLPVFLVFSTAYSLLWLLCLKKLLRRLETALHNSFS